MQPATSLRSSAKKRSTMHSLKLMKDSLWRLFCGASITLVAVSILFVTTSASAACGDPLGLKSGAFSKLPFLVQLGGGAGLAHQTEGPGNNSSIVGLWYVNYSSGGQPLYESFDQWHSDGTELENPNLAPATGPLCVGVWKQVGARTFRLHHVGWNFDNLQRTEHQLLTRAGCCIAIQTIIPFKREFSS